MDLGYAAASPTCGGTLLSAQPQASSPQYIAVTPLRHPCVVPSHVMMMEYPDPPSNAVTPPTIAPTPVYARHPNLSIITDLPRDLSEPTDSQTGDNSVSYNAESEGDDRLPAVRRRKKAQTGRASGREKMYKCPVSPLSPKKAFCVLIQSFLFLIASWLRKGEHDPILFKFFC